MQDTQEDGVWIQERPHVIHPHHHADKGRDAIGDDRNLGKIQGHQSQEQRGHQTERRRRVLIKEMNGIPIQGSVPSKR